MQGCRGPEIVMNSLPKKGSNDGLLPHAPWVLYFDGASRKPAGHAALGAVLKNSHGHLVQEVQRYIGSGLTSGMAKYEALITGMKKARSLHVNHLLAKCNSRLLIKQVVGRWSVKDTHLEEDLKKVLLLAKEFECIFMECIPKDQNLHADRLANLAIDKKLQIAEAMMAELYDRGSRPPTTRATSGKPDRPFISFGKPQLLMSTKLMPPDKLTLKECDETSDSELTRAIKSIGSGSPSLWHGDLDRLSISEESTSEEDSEIKELDRSSDDLDASQATRVCDDVASDTDRAPTGDDFPVLINTSKQTLAELHHDNKGTVVKDDHQIQDGTNFVGDTTLNPIPISSKLAPNPQTTGLLSEADYNRLITDVIKWLKTKC